MAQTNDLSPLARTRRIQIEWSIGETEKLARLIHAEPNTLGAWLASTHDDGALPAGLEGIQRLIKIQDCLAPQIPLPEKQVEWLFTPRKDWDGGRPIDIMSSSFEELSWLAYWLDSVTSQPQGERETTNPSPADEERGHS